MSTIPDYRQLKRDIPQARGDIDTRGVGANIGKSLLAVADVTSDVYRARIEKETSDADAEMYTHLVGSANSFDEDDDHDTMRNRFDTDATGKLGEVAAKITDANQRNAFVNKYKKEIASRGEQVSNQAWSKKVDFEKANLFDRLNNIRDTSLRDKSPDGLARANELFTKSINSARELNYIDEATGAKLHKQMQDDTAKAYVTMLPLEKRLGALKLLKKRLPPDDLAALKKGIEDELIINQSQDQADEYLDSDMNRAEVMKAIDKKFSKKPELRKATEARYDYIAQKRKIAITEQRTELKDKWYGDIALGDKTIADIKAEGEWDVMGADVQRTMIAAQKTSVSSTKVPFNVDHHDHLYQLKIASDRGNKDAGIEMREYVLKNFSTMSTKQQEDWSSASIDGLIPPEVDSGLTDIQTISAKLPATSDAEKRRVMLGDMGEWRKNYIADYGKNPSSEDRDKQIDRMFLEYDAGWRWTQKPFYEMPVEERRKVLSDMREENPKEWARAKKFYEDKGVLPRPEELMQKMTELTNAGQ